METPQSYCDAVGHLPDDNVHRVYHDSAYGFPIADDNELFGRLILEINQAGLSWTTILNKQRNFREAYAQFDIATIAAFTADDRERLLNDAGIIRNRLKVNAAIHNAQVVIGIQKTYGSFKNWLDDQGVLTRKEWVKLFKQTFKFTGGEITNEFLMSSGYLPGAHVESCPVYQLVVAQRPVWLKYAGRQ